MKIVEKIDIRLDNVGIWWGIIPCEEPDRAMKQKAQHSVLALARRAHRAQERR